MGRVGKVCPLSEEDVVEQCKQTSTHWVTIIRFLNELFCKQAILTLNNISPLQEVKRFTVTEVA